MRSPPWFVRWPFFGAGRGHCGPSVGGSSADPFLPGSVLALAVLELRAPWSLLAFCAVPYNCPEQAPTLDPEVGFCFSRCPKNCRRGFCSPVLTDH
eukprot:14230260-Alexandrium_andersonii.AAC.1